MNRIGFDSERYLKMQSEKILERINRFGGKLYLEFGGKLFDDFHAARVLPGFKPDNKIVMLETLKDMAEIVIVINSEDIAKNKLRQDLGITYDADVLRLIDIFRAHGLYVGSVVLGKYTDGNLPAAAFRKKLQKLGLKVYRHYTIRDYPYNVPLVLSEEGCGKNEYVETERQLVVVTAPGPGSGKMATCMSQLYHDHQRGIQSGYAKYETFPIWNIPLNHPVNIAYEAATADLDDVNVIDPWHLAAYNKVAVNYNRDVDNFPVLNALFEKLMGSSPYRSPTDMGVNMAGFAISDDEVCKEAARQEIIRRYYKALVAARRGHQGAEEEAERIRRLMENSEILPEQRTVVNAAAEKAKKTGAPAAAIELKDGRIVTGKTSALLGCSSAMLLNALKTLAGVPDKTELISPSAIEPIQTLKTRLGGQNPRLHTDETLIALSISAATNPAAALALEQLDALADCDVHTTTILSPVDENTFRRLRVNVTSDPVYSTKKLFQK